MAEPTPFVQRQVGVKNCDGDVIGIKHPDFDYIHRSTTGDDEYPEDACPRYLQVNGKFDALQVVNNTTVGGNVQVTGNVTATEVTANGITLTSRKSFDIPHPVKKGYRLRHVCLEGPEAGVYYRGRLTNSNIIELPEYWRGLIDPETISVSLTQIKTSQDLIVEEIEWGTRIKIKSGNGTGIDCYYLVHAERKDGERLIVEYEGDTYPGDDSQYSLNR
jgi:hypothetical protein